MGFPRRREGERGMDWIGLLVPGMEPGTSRYKLLNIERINN